MTKLEEGKLEFDFVGALDGYKFDEPKTHGANAMRQVDFVVEWEKEIWLVEVKDPVSTPDATRRTEVRRFRSNLLMRPLRLRDALKVSNMREMLEGIEKELLHNALGRKARDSFLYLHLKNTYPGKSVKFLVLYTEDRSDSRMLTSATKSLKNACVFGGPFKRGWAIPYLQDVQILNLQSWRVLYPTIPIRRLTSESSLLDPT